MELKRHIRRILLTNRVALNAEGRVRRFLLRQHVRARTLSAIAATCSWQEALLVHNTVKSRIPGSFFLYKKSFKRLCFLLKISPSADIGKAILLLSSTEHYDNRRKLRRRKRLFKLWMKQVARDRAGLERLREFMENNHRKFDPLRKSSVYQWVIARLADCS